MISPPAGIEFRMNASTVPAAPLRVASAHADDRAKVNQGAQRVDRLDVENASREHFARIHRAALILAGNPWDADDLAQETFLVFARRVSDFEGRSSLYTWLYGILLNLDRRQRRRVGTERRKLRVLWSSEPVQAGTSPAANIAIDNADWSRSLWAQVARLPDAQRQALVLRFSEHLAYDEIAQILGCPLGTVKSRIFNGLATLRTLCMDEGPATVKAVP
jgi:RNA polymerase sigma-70 factor, ECF subfamily